MWLDWAAVQRAARCGITSQRECDKSADAAACALALARHVASNGCHGSVRHRLGVACGRTRSVPWPFASSSVSLSRKAAGVSRVEQIERAQSQLQRHGRSRHRRARDAQIAEAPAGAAAPYPPGHRRRRLQARERAAARDRPQPVGRARPPRAARDGRPSSRRQPGFGRKGLASRARRARGGERRASAARGAAMQAGAEPAGEAKKRFARLRLAGSGFDVVGAGLETSYRKARRAFRDAYDEPTDEAFHEWRKGAQPHWRQMTLLSRAWPEYLGARASEARSLSQILGDDHDLAHARRLRALGRGRRHRRRAGRADREGWRASGSRSCAQRAKPRGAAAVRRRRRSRCAAASRPTGRRPSR